MRSCWLVMGVTRVVAGGVLLLGVALAPRPAGSEVLPVPDSIRTMTAPREQVHILRSSASGTRLGVQRFRAERRGNTFELTVRTQFDDGERWLEQAMMDLAQGYRARSYRRRARRDGTLISEQTVDFASGLARWSGDGERRERRFALPPDTYMGPMLGLVLADVVTRPAGVASFQVLTFRPQPDVYTVRATVLAGRVFRAGGAAAPATKVRVRVDLGDVQNLLFASLIPTHYFWFTRTDTPEFYAFEGTLSHDRAEMIMVPEDYAGNGRVAAR